MGTATFEEAGGRRLQNLEDQDLIYQRCGVPTIKIFMDDLHICPNCGRCWPFGFRNEFFDHLPEWLEWESQKIRELALSRLGAKEFYFAQCPNKRACARFRSSIVKRFQGKPLLFEDVPTQPVFETSKTVAATVAAQEAITNFVYLVRQERFIKIGIARKPERRSSALRIGSPFKDRLAEEVAL